MQQQQEAHVIKTSVVEEIVKNVKKIPPAAENHPTNVAPHLAAPLGDGVKGGWMRERGGD
jgi:hypothetical protein